MNATTLYQAVARATGETVRRITRMGFQVLPMPQVPLSPSSPRPNGKRRRQRRRW